jgi:hypothetical protein
VSFEPHNGGYRDPAKKKRPSWLETLLNSALDLALCWSNPHFDEGAGLPYHVRCHRCERWVFVGP